MKHYFIGALAALTVAGPVAAEAISVAKAPLAGGMAIFELYTDRAVLPECQSAGSNPSGLIVKLETPKGIIPYGTGCWIARMDGNIWMAVKSFDDGMVREKVVHNSQFKALRSDVTSSHSTMPAEPTGKAKELVDRISALNTKCRSSPDATQACDQREATMRELRKLGWCWGPEDAIGADKHWIRCR